MRVISVLLLLSVACATSPSQPAKPIACERGALGIEPDDISRDFRRLHELPAGLHGARVSLVLDGSPAAAAGVRAGDVVLQVGQTEVTDSCTAIDSLFAGECKPTNLVLWRDGDRKEITITPTPEQPLLARACQEGSAAACFRLGWLLFSGTGVPADRDAALARYRNACDGGWAEACAYLGVHLIDDPAAATTEVLTVLDRACELGSSAGCSHLAFLYATGTRVPQDDVRATPLYVRSCDLGDPLGCYNVGLMYNAGRGVERDVARAVAADEEGCRGGSSSACTDLGWLYQQGIGVVKDEARAVELYRLGCAGTSCQPPNRLGCVNLGRAYRDGIGIAADPRRAEEIFREACEKEVDSGDPSSRENQARACSLLGALYLGDDVIAEDYATGLTLSRRGCDGADPFGCFNTGVIYAYGLGVEIDMTEAAKYYELACGFDDAEGCFKASQLYSEGKGVAKSAARARELARKACDGGFAEACSGAGK